MTNYQKELVAKLNQWIHCMSYNDSYFGEPSGFLKQTIRQLAKDVEAEERYAKEVALREEEK